MKSQGLGTGEKWSEFQQSVKGVDVTFKVTQMNPAATSSGDAYLELAKSPDCGP